MRRPTLAVSASVAIGPSEPGTTDTPIFAASSRARTLSPMAWMADGGGPTKQRPCSSHFSAKPAFSARKP